MNSCIVMSPKYYEKDNHMRVKAYARFDQGSDEILPDSDPKSFSQLNDYYSKDATHVYFYQLYSKLWVLKNVDPSSFTALSNDYACDAQHVWNGGHLISNADPKEFQILPFGYARTATTVYRSSLYNGAHILENADPVTFEPINHDYAKDKNTVFCNLKAFKVSDIASFVPVKSADGDNYSWAKDKNNIYNFSEHFLGIVYQIPIGDYDTFEAIDSYYARDKYQVYYKDSIIRNADPQTFKLLEARFSRDKEHVFDEHKLVEGADPKTFTVIDFHKGKDKYRKYELK